MTTRGGICMCPFDLQMVYRPNFPPSARAWPPPFAFRRLQHSMWLCFTRHPLGKIWSSRVSFYKFLHTYQNSRFAGMGIDPQLGFGTQQEHTVFVAGGCPEFKPSGLWCVMNCRSYSTSRSGQLRCDCHVSLVFYRADTRFVFTTCPTFHLFRYILCGICREKLIPHVRWECFLEWCKGL